MKVLKILLLVLPFCAAQFRIQGPSDGNRRAQGLKYDAEKGIQYDDQRDSLGAGDFSITGASDGNSDFKIQGPSDGNSDFQIHGATDGNANFHIRGATDSNAQFQIQGATDGNADFQIQGATDGNANFHIQGATDENANFQIQGATDGHSQSTVQGPYDANQGQRALSYKDSSGSTINWKSYQHTASAQPQQLQPQYEEPVQYAPAPAPRRKAHRPAPQQAQVAPENNYKVFNTAPPSIQQLLQFQQQIPYQNSIPQQFRYDFNAPIPPALAGHQEQAPVHQEPAPLPQEQPTRSQYRGKPRGQHRRQKRAAQRQGRQRHEQQQQRASAPPPEQQPRLSNNIPPRIQEILQFQAMIPYINPIPEQWRFEKLLEQEKNLPPPQYERQPAPQPIRHSQKVREKREAQHQEAQPKYSANLPPQLAQLLKFQASTPYTSVIPDQFSYEKLLAAQKAHRQKRQAPQYQHNQESQQGIDLSQYKRISQPQVNQPLPQYSSNLPSSLQQLLKFQSQVPYDIIANQIQARLDKPYVPQPIQAAPTSHTPQPNPQYQQPLAEPPQYQQPQRPLYQPTQPQYQNPAYQSAPLTQPQYQPSPVPAPQYQQPQAPIYNPAPLPQPQAQKPIYQNPQLLQPQYQSNSSPQSQLIRPQFHPNQIPQYDPSHQSPYGQTNNPIRPVTENQY